MVLRRFLKSTFGHKNFVKACNMGLPSLNDSKMTAEPQDTTIGNAPLPSYSISSYINESPVLQRLLLLGVDISLAQKIPGARKLLLSLNIETNVIPRLTFFVRLGIDYRDVGKILSTNPRLFHEHMRDIEARYDYFVAKGFDKVTMNQMIKSSPTVLTQPVRTTDGQLGVLQRLFNLTGSEIRSLCKISGSILTTPIENILGARRFYSNIIGLNDVECRALFLSHPPLFQTERLGSIEKRWVYLTTTGYSTKAVMHWPPALLARRRVVDPRVSFLKELHKNFTDPSSSDFISLRNLTTGTHSGFCKDLKIPEEMFAKFMRTL